MSFQALNSRIDDEFGKSYREKLKALVTDEECSYSTRKPRTSLVPSSSLPHLSRNATSDQPHAERQHPDDGRLAHSEMRRSVGSFFRGKSPAQQRASDTGHQVRAELGLPAAARTAHAGWRPQAEGRATSVPARKVGRRDSSKNLPPTEDTLPQMEDNDGRRGSMSIGSKERRDRRNSYSGPMEGKENKDVGLQRAKEKRTFTNPDERMLMDVAFETRLPLELIHQAYDLWHPHGALNEELSRPVVVKVLCKLTGCKTSDELPEGLLANALRFSNSKDGAPAAERLGFLQFLEFFVAHSFREDMVCSAGERRFRHLCRKYDMELVDVETYRRIFDSFDVSGDGKLCQKEFEGMLRRCAKVPANVDIPANRFENFWHEADLNGSGNIDFEEFLVFYRKYFDVAHGEGGGNAGCFETFYRNIRALS